MRYGFRAIAVWLAAASITVGQAERQSLADLGSTGELAVRDAEDSEWRAILAGEPVPERAQFRVSSRGGGVVNRSSQRTAHLDWLSTTRNPVNHSARVREFREPNVGRLSAINGIAWEV